jgi:membrane-associated phospholipid phosphatase
MLLLAGIVYGIGLAIFGILAFVLTAGFPSHGDEWKVWLSILFWPISFPIGIARSYLEG